MPAQSLQEGSSKMSQTSPSPPASVIAAQPRLLDEPSSTKSEVD
jgi:hypothetical protein